LKSNFDISINIVLVESSYKFISFLLDDISKQDNKNYEINILNNSNFSFYDKVCSKHVNDKINLYNKMPRDGFCKNHNFLIDKSKNELILILNPDIRLENNFLSVARKTFIENKIDMLSPCIFRINDISRLENTLLDSAGMHLRYDFRHLDILANKKSSKVVSEMKYVFGATGAACFVKKSILDKVKLYNGNYFDEDFFMGREDADLSFRIQSLNGKCLFVPECKAYHIRTTLPENRSEQSKFYNFHQLKNRYILMINNMSRLTFIFFCLPIFFREILIFGYVLFFERNSLKSYLWIYNNFRKLKKKREFIFKNKTQTSFDEIYWYFKKYKNLKV